MFSFYNTCAKVNGHFTDSIRKEAEKKGSLILGEYGCRGFNTYGPLKFIGGMNKNRPNAEEIQEAILFYESVCKQITE